MSEASKSADALGGALRFLGFLSPLNTNGFTIVKERSLSSVANNFVP